MGFKQHISRTWQMIEQQVNDVPFRPDDEELRQIKLVITFHKLSYRYGGTENTVWYASIYANTCLAYANLCWKNVRFYVSMI